LAVLDEHRRQPGVQATRRADFACFGAGLRGSTLSHVRLTTPEHGEHHITIPRHELLRARTVATIPGDVDDCVGLWLEALVERLLAR
jgi:hypothetical protein